MKWLNLEVAQLRAPEYIGSEPVQRATWLNVLAYCVDLENGGRIVGGASWKDRQWQQSCGVTKAEVEGAAPLIEIDGDDVVVWSYPHAQEELVRSRRNYGALGGRPRKTKTKPYAKPNGNHKVNHNETLSETIKKPYAETKRKGRERKGKEMEEKRAQERADTPPPAAKNRWLPEGDGDRGEAPPVIEDRRPASKPIPADLDHLIVAGARVGRDERPAWQLLVDQRGLDACLAAVRSLKDRGQAAWLSQVRDGLDEVAAGSDDQWVEVPDDG